MRKFILILILALTNKLLFAQISGYEIHQSIVPEIHVPGSANAAIVKSGTIDLPNNTSLIGIVWSNNINDGYLYVDNLINSNTAPSPAPLVPTTPIDIDPGYLIGNVDIAMVPYVDPTLGSTAYGALIKIMYQRRLTNTAPWEIILKTYTSNNVTGITNITQLGATLNLGIGKHVAIDAFVHVDKMMPSSNIYSFDYFTIGWGTVNGYEVRVIDLFDNVYNSNLLPYTFTANHMRNDSVTHIDIACVREVGIAPNGVMPLDRVYIVVRDACNINTHCESHIWEWSVDYAMGGSGSLVPIDTIHGASLSGRFRIEAMSIQNEALNEPKYNVLVCLDGTVVFYYSRIGTTNYDLNTLPSEYIDPLSGFPTGGGPGETFDIAGGIGVYGDQNFVANRHYNVLRELDFTDKIFVSGIERNSFILSYPIGLTSVVAEDISEVVNLPRIVNYNDGMPTWGYPALNNPKLFDNISTTSSTNSGKCILNTWTNQAGSINQNVNAIFYKFMQAENDLNTPPTTPPTHWNAKSLNSIGNNALQLYPNPVKDLIKIYHESLNIKTLQLYSIDGKQIDVHMDISENYAIIATDKLLSGTYLVQVILENGQAIQRIVVK